MDAGAVEPRRPLWQMILDGVVAASTLVVAIVVVHSFATRPGIDVGEGKRPALFVQPNQFPLTARRSRETHEPESC